MSECRSVMRALFMTPCGSPSTSPKVIQNDKGEYLVEYRYFDFKLGYFVVEVDNDRFWLPPSCSSRCREHRRQVLYISTRQQPPPSTKPAGHPRLELDSLHTYLLTDLQKDEELVRIFDTVRAADTY